MLLLSYETTIVIIPMLIIVSISAIMEFFAKEKITLALYIMFLVICFLHPTFLLGIPLILYDLFFTDNQIVSVIVLIPWMINVQSYGVNINIFLFVMTIISVILKYKAVQYKKLHEEYIEKRDELMEMSINLEKKVDDLMGREEFQVKLATLNERNRIAREIHDNVGHLLASSILQIGAVLAITKEDATKAMLTNIKDTLDEGMNSIRNSVHNLHEDSVDLYIQLKNIVDDFSFCETVLNYEMNIDLDIKIKYALIAIVKEALANVMKHSNATKVIISLYEHPKLIQLIIIDNGSKKSVKKDNGMGLEGIKNRVNNLGGITNFDESNGFKIFISFMKGVDKHENSCCR